MRGLRGLTWTGLLLVAVCCWSFARPATASAGVCGAAGDANKVAGGACDLLTNPGKDLSVGKKLANGKLGGAVKTLLGGASSASTASTALGLAAIVTWVAGGARFSLDETTKVLGESTTPQLRSTWFSSRYWHIAGIAALLTLPFLFAAAIQALIHSDPALLTRAAVGYLPLAALAIAVAAPVAMLLLAATDQLCTGLSGAAGGIHPSLTRAALGAGLLSAPFLRFLISLVTTACALILWLELAIREAAVYVIVLMLPLAFAAFVWPARRVWAVRAVELLVALILSKLAIVAVIDLGGAALDQFPHQGGGLAAGLAGTVLVLLAALSPWAVLRLVPMSELASSAAGSLRGEASAGLPRRRADERLLWQSSDEKPEPANGSATPLDTPAAQAEVQRLSELSRDASGSRGARQAPASASHDASEADLLGGDAPAAGAAADPSLAGAAANPSLAGAGKATAGGPRDDAAAGARASGSVGDGFEGWPAMYHAGNYSWKPLTLGSDGDVMNARLWPPDEPEDDPGPAEDHEPLPPRQEDGEGSL